MKDHKRKTRQGKGESSKESRMDRQRRRRRMEDISTYVYDVY